MKKYLSLLTIVISFVLLGVGCSNNATPDNQTAPVNQLPVPNAVAPKELSTPIDGLDVQNTKPVINTQTPTSKVTIKMQNFTFQPANLSVKAGTTVVWANNDSAPHTVSADDGSFDSGSMSKGGNFSYTFTVPGTVTYNCAFHKSMRGSIIVTE